MRIAIALTIVAAALAAPASAIQIKPIELVLHQIEVPPGYEYDEDNSLAIPNALFAAKPEARLIVARSGRLGGYYARYTNYGPPHWRHVGSSADLFRGPVGADVYFAWYVQQFRKSANEPIKRTSVHIGTKARLYSGRSPEVGTLVIWRYSRVVAWVTCQEMTQHRKLALALARTQQRRIAAALR